MSSNLEILFVLVNLQEQNIALRDEVQVLSKKLRDVEWLIKQRNEHELTPNLPDCHCPVCNVHRQNQRLLNQA